MTRLSDYVSDRLVRWRWAWLMLAVGIGIAAWGPSRTLDFDRTLETMFAAGDPLMPPYHKLKRIFGYNEIALAVYDDPELLSPTKAGVERLAGVRRRLAQVPGVIGTLGLDSPLGDDIVDPERRLAPRMRGLFEDFTHGSDGHTVCVVCALAARDQTAVPRAETIAGLRAIMNDLPGGLSPGMLAGEPVMTVDAFQYVEDDGQRLFVASTVLMGIVILLLFRSIRWVLIPIAVVQFALIVTKALLVWTDIRMTMVSSMLTAIVTVIGVATVVHAIVRFRDARDQGLEPRAALLHAARLLVAPVSWACITDAVGFASLGVAELTPVRNFGAMMALGSIMVLLSVGLLVPGLALLGQRDTDPKRVWGESVLDQALGRLSRWIALRSGRVMAVAAVLSALTILGIGRLETETDFTRNFRRDTEIVRSYELIESKLGGAGLCDLIIPAPSYLDWKYLRRVLVLESRLRREVRVGAENEPRPAAAGSAKRPAGPRDSRRTERLPGAPALTKVISLADAIRYTAPSNLDRVRTLLRRHLVRAALRRLRKSLPDFYDALYASDPANPEQYYMRVMLRARERQPAHQKREIIDRVAAIAREEFPEAEVTGTFVLLTHLIDSLVRDQWRTFAVAIIGIGIAMTVAFRSIRYALVALVPNGLPILMVMGLMGWVGLRVNMGAAMIAAVSVGLSVDSSIHYITAFLRQRAEGQSVQAALDTVQQSVGRAVVFSTLALVTGFLVLSTSHLIPIVYFGILVSMAMLGGLFGNLLILPILLKLVSPDE